MKSCREILDNIKFKQYQTAGYYQNPYTYNSQFNFLPNYVLPNLIQGIRDYKDEDLTDKKKQRKLIGDGVTSAFGLLNGAANVNYYQNQLERQRDLLRPNYTNISYDHRYNSINTDMYQAYQVGGNVKTITNIKDFYNKQLTTPEFLTKYSKLYTNSNETDVIQTDINLLKTSINNVPVKKGNEYFYSGEKDKIFYDLDDKEIPFETGIVHEISHKKRNESFPYVGKKVDRDFSEYFNLENVKDTHDNNVEERASDLDVLRYKLQQDKIFPNSYKKFDDDDSVKILKYLESQDDYFLKRLKRLVKPEKLKDALNDFVNISEKVSNVSQVGGINKFGYKDYSPFKNEPYLDIVSSNISMQGVSQPLLGVSDKGERKIMYPNKDYYFKDANVVREIPLKNIKYELGGEEESEQVDFYNYTDYSDDLDKMFQEEDDYWKQDDDDLMFTLSEEVKETISNNRRNRFVEPQFEYRSDYSKGSGSIAVRHNNPGNIKYGKFASQYGASQGEYSMREKDGTYYASFPTIEAGLAAQRGLLLSKNYRDLSVPQALNRWAASTYTDKNFINMFGNRKVKDLSEEELKLLQKEQIRHEDANMYKLIYK